MGEERLILEEGLESHKERLISDMDKLIEAVKEKGECINGIQKELNDVRWFLGEERAGKEQLENTLKWFEQKCQDLEAQINELRTECEHLKKELADARWYLGEERAKRQELERMMKTA